MPSVTDVLEQGSASFFLKGQVILGWPKVHSIFWKTVWKNPMNFYLSQQLRPVVSCQNYNTLPLQCKNSLDNTEQHANKTVYRNRAVAHRPPLTDSP